MWSLNQCLIFNRLKLTDQFTSEFVFKFLLRAKNVKKRDTFLDWVLEINVLKIITPIQIYLEI